MAAAWVLARAGLRSRWRSLAVLVLVVGVGAGTALGLIAGARRSDTVVTRFRESSRLADVLVQTDVADDARVGTLRADPAVAAASPLAVVFARVAGSRDDALRESQVRVAIDGSYGSAVDRGRLLEGSPLDHHDPSAVEMSESMAHRLHLGVGDRLELETLTQEQVEAGFFEGRPTGDPAGPRLRLRVTSVVQPGPEVLGLAEEGGVLLTRALWEQVGDPIRPGDSSDTSTGGMGGFDNTVLAIARGGDVQGAVDAARNVFRDDDELFVEQVTEEAAGIEDLANVVAVSFVLAGVAVGLTSLAIASQALWRHAVSEAELAPALAGLGVTRLGRAAGAALPLGVAAGGAGLVALVVAVAISPRFPIGDLRPLEPHPGVHVDPLVLGLGAPLLVTLLGAMALASAWRAEALPANRPVLRRVRMPFAGPVTAVTAQRLAPDRRTVPALAGAVVALGGVAASVTFGASMHRFSHDPARDGWPWDAELQLADGLPDEDALAVARDLAERPVVDGVLYARAATLGSEGDGDDTPVLGIVQVEGGAGLTLLEGRLPQDSTEVALGSDTARRRDVGVGDQIDVGGSDARDVRVTGIARFPVLVTDTPAEGIVLTLDGLAAVAPPVEDGAFGFPTALANWAPGTTDEVALRALADDFDVHAGAELSSDASNLRAVGGIPGSVALVLAGLGTLAVLQALLVVVRRRRRDLAVLRALGFRRSQLGALLHTQALAYGGVGVLIGLPLGIALGRWSWRLLADRLGAAADPLTPAALAVAVPVTLVVVLLVAAVPAMVAARTGPAALRTE